jgi:Fur family ferric uptake transcriptional regulator
VTQEDPRRRSLRDAGLKVTASRVGVLELLQRVNKPITHAEVAEHLGDAGWDRATLYRNLIDLSDAGLLNRVSLGSVWHFEAATKHGGGHPHFVCVECGSVRCTPELRVRLPKTKSAPRALRRGEVELQLHGVCDRCAAA